MKRKLLLAFIVVSISASAQTSVYHPFADSGAVWVMQWTNACITPPCVLGCNADYQYRIDGDTILSSVIYKKVIKEGYTINNCNCIMNVPSCSGSTYYSSFYCGIRDDVANRRSYINDGVNPEELLFDFNMQVGDSIQNRFCMQQIIYLDSVQVGSSYRRSFMVSGNSTIIEGIGYFDGGFYDGPFEGCGACVCNDIWRLQCYRLNGVVLLGDIGCALVTSVNETPELNSSVELFPNPATNEIRIESIGFMIESIEIYNVLGQRVYSEQPTTGNPQPVTVNVSGWNAGIYFVKALGENKQAVVKLVKE